MKRDMFELLKGQIMKSPFGKNLGITVRDIGPGYAKVEARYSEKMYNFHGLIHGGAIFALIDEAFGAASNSHGTMAVALNMNITFIRSPQVDSLLVAEAKEESRSKNTATYRVEVHQEGENGYKKIAVCQALVYRKDRILPFLEDH